MSKKLANFVILVLFAILSAVCTIKVRSLNESTKAKEQSQQEIIESYESQILELKDEIALQSEENAELKERYNTELENLRITDSTFYNYYQTYSDGLTAYRKLAGLSTVSGSGVIIKLDDSGLVKGSLVHDEYILKIINVLKAAGAQAISVNGERVLPFSEVLCLGPSIRVNGERLFAPYRIYAIGDADALYKAYKESQIYATIVAQNLLYDVQTSDSIVIGPYSGNYKDMITRLYS